jgi:hypothetical protein
LSLLDSNNEKNTKQTPVGLSSFTATLDQKTGREKETVMRFSWACSTKQGLLLVAFTGPQARPETRIFFGLHESFH